MDVKKQTKYFNIFTLNPHLFIFPAVIFIFLNTYLTLVNAKEKNIIKIKIASVAPEGSPWEIGISNILKNITTSSKGTIKSKFFKSGILGDEVSTLKRFLKGEIEMWAGSHAMAFTYL